MHTIVYMREQWVSTLRVVLLGLLLLIPATPHATETVLCVEDSGAVNIERADDGECTERIRLHAEQNPEAVEAATAEHCADCADVPLRVSEVDDPCGQAVLAPSLELETPRETGTLIAVVSGTGLFPDRDATRLSSQQDARSARPNADREASLGSVVLLI